MSKIQPKTDQKARELLLSYGVQYFRHKGGFIAGNAPIEECGLCDCKWEINKKYLINYYGSVVSRYYEPRFEQELIGEVIYLAGYASCCYECAHKINQEFDRADIYIISWLADEYCQLCGEYCDGIPF